MSFQFSGEVPASKSILNRSLIAQSYFPELQLLGDSNCEDVLHMKRGLLELTKKSSKIFCGDGGTTFRFLALRASREDRPVLISGSERLLNRPQDDILPILESLGVAASFDSRGLTIQSGGWQQPSAPLKVNIERTSQFASSLFLNAWSLPFDLEMTVEGHHSMSYLRLTLDLLKSLGMEIHLSGDTYFIPQGQKIREKRFRVESDVSSCFSVAALGAVAGRAEILNFPFASSQPDLKFLDFFSEMQIPWIRKGESLLIEKASSLKPLPSADLSQCPDLFPVLAMLCAQAEGLSYLGKAPQLVHKESNRIQKVADLLNPLGVRYEVMNDGMKIYGNTASSKGDSFKFDPDEDHRMVMAASVLKVLDYPVEIMNPQVINKSYPDFLSIAGIK